MLVLKNALVALSLAMCLVAAMVAPAMAQAVPSLSCHDEAGSIAKATKAAGISKVAVVPFMCNGGASSPIAETVREKLLEELVEQDGIQCFDRGEAQLVATEAGLSCPGEAAKGAEAVLTGEVFCAPSNSTGFVAYRLIATADSRILAVGFKQVTWDEDELDMFSGSVRTMSYDSFSLIDQAQLDSLKGKIAKLKGGKVAMVYDGSQNADNTLEARMAFIQVLAAISQAPVDLYEREFLQNLAQENSLDNQTAHPGPGIAAVGHTKLKPSKGGVNTVIVQVLGVPENNLLLAASVKQTKGPNAGGAYGNDGSNGLRERLARLDKDERDVKLVYEAEVVIDDGYEPNIFVVPGCVEVKETSVSWERGRASCFKEQVPKELKQFFEAAFRYIHRFSSDKPDMVEKYLTLGAIYGMYVDVPEIGNRGLLYIGPASMCFDEIYKNVIVIGESVNKDMPTPHRAWINEFKYPLLKGRYKEEPYCYDYEYRVQWRDGLPYKVYAKIDLTPMKDKLLRRDSKQ